MGGTTSGSSGTLEQEVWYEPSLPDQSLGQGEAGLEYVVDPASLVVGAVSSSARSDIGF